MIGNLEAIVREFIGTEKKGTAKTAIVLLGELRANESASLLADNLTFKVFYKETKRLRSWTINILPLAPSLLSDRQPLFRYLTT